MFHYQDKTAKNIAVSVDKENPALLAIAAFTLSGVKVPACKLDLTEYQGKTFRLWAEADGSFSTAIQPEHYWLLLEGNIPARKYQNVGTGTMDERGEEQQKMEELPLDLSDVDFTVFSLPEQEEE